MTAVARVLTKPFELPLRGELRWGRAGELTRLRHVLVAVSDDAGNVGVAEAPVRPSIYGETVASVEAIVRHFETSLIGLEVDDVAAQQAALVRVPNNHCAKGALDTALCELRAKAHGTTLFGAERGERERLGVSFILGVAEPDVMLDEATRVYEAGVRVFKVKVGRDRAHDARVLEMLNATFAGAGVTLYADANEGLETETAARDLGRFAKLGVRYVEEPLPVHLIWERAMLRAAEVLPVIADDSCFTLPDLERELAFDTFDILNLKTARTGFTASGRMLDLARGAGKGVMVGSQASAGLGTLHAGVFGSKAGVTGPCELSFPLKLGADILNAPLRFEDGFLEMAGLEPLHLADEVAAELFA